MRMMFVGAVLALGLLSVPSARADWEWNGSQYQYVGDDRVVVTEATVDEVTIAPRRSVTRTVTSSTSTVAAPVVACATVQASACSSSVTRTVVRERRFAPVRRLFGVRLRGC